VKGRRERRAEERACREERSCDQVDDGLDFEGQRQSASERISRAAVSVIITVTPDSEGSVGGVESYIVSQDGMDYEDFLMPLLFGMTDLSAMLLSALCYEQDRCPK